MNFETGQIHVKEMKDGWFFKILFYYFFCRGRVMSWDMGKCKAYLVRKEWVGERDETVSVAFN